MYLTGKNKENFEKWYIGYAQSKNSSINANDYKTEILEALYELDFMYQLGVYLEYFNSIGCWAEHSFEYKGCKAIMNGGSLGFFKTMNEAYKEAFKKADEIANLTLK